MNLGVNSAPTSTFLMDSQLDTSATSFDISSHGGDITQFVLSTFKELKGVRKVHPRKFVVAHSNINSLKTNFDEIHELLNENIYFKKQYIYMQ